MLVLLERPAEILLHAIAIRGEPLVVALAAGATDQEVGPDAGPVAGVFFDVIFAQQAIHEIDSPIAALVAQETLQLVEPRNPADDVEIDPAAPVAVARHLGRSEMMVGPTLPHRLVDDLDLRRQGRGLTGCRL